MSDKDQISHEGVLLLSAQRHFGVTLSIHGNPDLLRLTRRMLLVSRQNNTPQPDSPWLRALLGAARDAARTGSVLVCGCERLGYDLPRWVFENESGAGLVLIKHRSESYSPTKTPALVVEFETHDAQEIPVLRDKLVAHFSNAASVIAIRENGNMAELAAAFAARGVELDHRFETRTPAPEPHRWPARGITPYPASPWEYVTHFTREPLGAWPGETYTEYVKWLCTASKDERRDDAAALRRILLQRRIVGSGRFIRGGAPMVCWTALPPQGVASLRGWRKGLRRWNFTPYGIAIHRRAFQTLNARPVRYCSESELDHASQEDATYMQLANSGGYDWSREQEWRSAGDADLSAIAPADMLILTHTRDEADRFSDAFHIPALATG